MAINITGLISGASSAGSLVTNLANGSLFSGPLSLGDFHFKGWELPSHIEFGTQLQTTVHKLPGGRRIIDVMGPDQHPYTWDGIFEGPSAHRRLKALEQLRADGQAVELTFGQHSATVLITDLNFTYERSNWIKYKINCVVAPSPDDDEQDGAESGGLLSDIKDAIKTVSDTIDDVQNMIDSYVDPVVNALTNVSNAVSPITSALGIGSPMLTAFQTGLQSVQDYGALTGLGAAAASYMSLDASMAGAQTTAQIGAAASGTALEAVAASAATGGAISTTPASAAALAVASAPAATPSTPLVWTMDDLLQACAASGMQAIIVIATGPLTTARRSLVVDGLVKAGAYPTLTAATNDLYAPGSTLNTPAQAVAYRDGVLAAYAQQSPAS